MTSELLCLLEWGYKGDINSVKESSFSYKKVIEFTFKRSNLESELNIIKNRLQNVLSAIDDEITLVQKDPNARGTIVDTIEIWLKPDEEQEDKWQCDYSRFQSDVSSLSPIEYWGNFNTFSMDNPISDIEKYPWMPVEVSPGVFGDITSSP